MSWAGLPSLSLLRAFEAAARHRSFTAAGRELNVTYVAVAQQVRRLEAHLGVSLIYRDGRSLALTNEGLRLAAALGDGLDIMKTAVRELLETEDLRPLQVTLTPSFAVSWLMPRIGLFRAKYPDIELMLNPSAEVVDMSRDGYDLAIRFGSGDWPGVDVELLLGSRLVMVAAPSLLRGKPVETPEDLLRLPWLQELGTGELGTWLAARGVRAVNKKNITHLPGYMLLPAVREGQGVGGVARVFVEDEIRSGRLVVLFEDGNEDTPVGYYLVRRKGPMRPPLKRFVSWLRSMAREDEARRDR
ncbi:LysR family transcriptional regulator [Stappia sp. F7233]|uniref:LysR family transcriptional regulator n=1 Tax=Stappia albiluteola TaxID=2758565 RepID=A0A839ACW9_9HYPH|nr:LysR substrate-binding domain-containing protein [Stappia albiluteola]MBA5777600.1 LysR family transcriptional regulator [Stappia albiluteola]